MESAMINLKPKYIRNVPYMTPYMTPFMNSNCTTKIVYPYIDPPSSLQKRDLMNVKTQKTGSSCA